MQLTCIMQHFFLVQMYNAAVTCYAFNGCLQKKWTKHPIRYRQVNGNACLLFNTNAISCDGRAFLFNVDVQCWYNLHRNLMDVCSKAKQNIQQSTRKSTATSFHSSSTLYPKHHTKSKYNIFTLQIRFTNSVRCKLFGTHLILGLPHLCMKSVWKVYIILSKAAAKASPGSVLYLTLRLF